MLNEECTCQQSSQKTTFRMATRLLRPIGRLLQTGQPSATVDRLFSSQHVGDLQLIIATSFLVITAVFVVGLGLAYEVERMAEWQTFKEQHSNWVYVHLAVAAAASFLRFFIPVLAVFGGVLAWAYQVGSARLGVVDLFACEISTLCRIITIADTARQYAEDFSRSSSARDVAVVQPPVSSFTSQENYFPVFEANNRDLQSLEARVVINITAFYTFMKATRDSLRKLAESRASSLEQNARMSAIDPWHESLRNVIYMMYLGLESARHAIHDLVEFDPEKAERETVILISELEAYRFLCERYTNRNDMHQRRIALRVVEYKRVVPRLLSEVGVEFAKEKASREERSRCPANTSGWQPAFELLPELKLRYDAAMEAARSCENSVSRPIRTSVGLELAH